MLLKSHAANTCVFADQYLITLNDKFDTTSDVINDESLES